MTNADSNTDRVADALPDSWVYRFLPKAVWPYAQLARWDRPIGWWLLLWPCWWSLALAINKFFLDPQVWEYWDFYAPPLVGAFIAFMIGAIAMRGAGCTYNDLVDVDYDAKVARTASRPIPSGRVSRMQAKIFIVAQLAIGALVLFYLCTLKDDFNRFAFLLALASLVIVLCYPFAKRITNWPQLVLGLAFSWGALMGEAVLFNDLHIEPLLLYAGSICWVIGYDTIYAHQDREDDALIGVKSTARLFGDKTKPALFILYGLTLALFAIAYWVGWAGWPAYLGLIIGAAHMIWQIHSLDIDDADKCLKLFQSNGHFGWIVFLGLLVDIVI